MIKVANEYKEESALELMNPKVKKWDKTFKLSTGPLLLAIKRFKKFTN